MITNKQLRKVLAANPNVNLHIMLPTGEFVPENFHVTEIGKVNKKFIDCGGTRRETVVCVLQVWTAKDYDHRLSSTKLDKIMQLAATLLGRKTLPLEVEYGKEYAVQYPVGGLEVTPNGILFTLGIKHTECLAPDKCGVSGCC